MKVDQSKLKPKDSCTTNLSIYQSFDCDRELNQEVSVNQPLCPHMSTNAVNNSITSVP